MPISTIPAQAGPSAESGLTGPGLRGLAEVAVKATARSLRPESLPAKTRRQPATPGCVRHRRAEASGRRRQPGPSRSGRRSARRFGDEEVAGGWGYRMGPLPASGCSGNGRGPACCARRGLQHLFRQSPCGACRIPVPASDHVEKGSIQNTGTHPGSAQIAGRVRQPGCTNPCGQR